MAIGTATAIALGAMAAASTASSAMAAKGAKDAAKTQAASGTEALGLTKEMYDQTRADLAPFRQVGTSAMTTLGGLMGLGGGAPGGAPAFTGQSQAPGPASSVYGNAVPAYQSGDVPDRPTRELGTPVGRLAERRDDRQLARIENRVASGYPAPAWYAGEQARQDGNVLMRAPDGTQQAVPYSQVEHYRGLGAQIVRG